MKTRYILSAGALAFGLLLMVIAWPRFVGGAVIAPDEDIMRKIARGEKITLRQIDVAREEAAVSADWFPYGRTLNLAGALELVRAGRASSAQAQRDALAESRMLLRTGLERSPGNAYAWVQLAQANLAIEGATPAINAPLRMSLKTAPYEHRLIIPRLDVALKSWSVLAPDIKDAMTPQILRAVDTAPRALATITRRNFALRQVRRAVASSEIHKSRFDIVYNSPD